MSEPLSVIAKEYAIACHEETNHYYGEGEPYSVHLQMVVNYVDKYFNCIPIESISEKLKEGYREEVYATAWCHDLIEDTRRTYNNVAEVVGHRVAENVYALTNEKGKTRAERANVKYYDGLISNYTAGFIKVCDRLANVKYSKDHGSSMFKAYVKEHEYFKAKLYLSEWVKMFMELDELIYN